MNMKSLFLKILTNILTTDVFANSQIYQKKNIYSFINI